MCLDAVQINVGDILAPYQEWYNYETDASLRIEKVNQVNSTFAGIYDLNREPAASSKFPFRGEFDPRGITVGWVVSYWNAYINDHALGAWAGYMSAGYDRETPSMMMSRIIAHESDRSTTSGTGTFVLKKD